MSFEVIFVPGIMGTELLDASDRSIWNGNVGTLWRTLTKDSRALNRDGIHPGAVVREMRLLKLSSPMYGPFLDRMVESSLQQHFSFHTFGYNWADSNNKSAKRLADAMRIRKEEGTKDFRIIAHSMGGLVVRLMLSNPANGDLLDNIKIFVQVGSPVYGAAKVYRALRDLPELDDRFDILINARLTLSSRARQRLSEAMRSLPSLYEVLPPEEVRILERNNVTHSAFDPGVWTALYDGMLGAAKQTHASLRQTVPVPHVVIQCDKLNTPAVYRVDTYYDQPKLIKSKMEIGDGTVTSSSAKAGSEPAVIWAPPGAVKHNVLLNHPKVQQRIDLALGVAG